MHHLDMQSTENGSVGVDYHCRKSVIIFQKLKLCNDAHAVFANASLIVFGWGYTLLNGRLSSSGLKLQLRMVHIPSANCRGRRTAVSTSIAVRSKSATARWYIYLPTPGPLDCLLHSGLAGRHSWLWTELAAVLTVRVTTGTLQWSRWTSISTFWQGTCHIIWKIKWKLGCSVRALDSLWSWALAQRTPATIWFQ